MHTKWDTIQQTKEKEREEIKIKEIKNKIVNLVNLRVQVWFSKEDTKIKLCKLMRLWVWICSTNKQKWKKILLVFLICECYYNDFGCIIEILNFIERGRDAH